MYLTVQIFGIFTLIFYVLLKWMKHYKIPSDFPPGPPVIPFLGVFPFIKGNFKQSMENWRKTYGDVIGFQLGSELAVILNDFEHISLAFRDSRFTGRPKSLQTVMAAFFSSAPNEPNAGIVFTDGQHWNEQRRFALKTLRDFGFGKECMETIIENEVEKLCQVLAAENSTSSHFLVQSLSVSVVNSIWTILTGEKIQHGDQTVKEIVNGTEEFIKNESLSGPIMMLPWLRHVPGIKGKFLESKSATYKMRQLQDKVVTKQQRNFHNNSSEESNNFIEAYLKQIGGTQNKDSSFYGSNGMLNLQRCLTDLFGAGSETSSSLLLFAFLYMIKYPEVQQKIQSEIHSLVGDVEPVALKHRRDLPYTDAALHEVMRHACLVYTVPHATTCDISMGGYTFPRATSVYANVWHIMHNVNYWKDPRAFKPERFLDECGKFKKDERCIPFMIGKRFCIGQSLAQIQLFLFFARLLQKFNFSAPEGPNNVSTDPIVGFLHSCPNYKVSITCKTKELFTT